MHAIDGEEPLALATIDDSENCRSSTAKSLVLSRMAFAASFRDGMRLEGPRLRGEVLFRRW